MHEILIIPIQKIYFDSNIKNSIKTFFKNSLNFSAYICIDLMILNIRLLIYGPIMPKYDLILLIIFLIHF